MAKIFVKEDPPAVEEVKDETCPTCGTSLKIQDRNEPTGGALYTPQRRTVCPKHGVIKDWTNTGNAFVPNH
jgi:hypothetical protein